MSSISIIFSRSRTPGAVLIRLATWSVWSHNGIVMPNGKVIEARWPHGVVETDISEFIARSSHHLTRRIFCPVPRRAYEFAREQLGKPYDTIGVIGLGLRREWNRPDAWWCSELVEAAIEAGGNQRFRHDVRRVTPQHSWMVM